MMGPQAVKGSACPARAAQSLKVFDLKLPCALCGYAIPPNELLHVGWPDIKCPAFGGVLTRGQAGHLNRKSTS